MAYKSILVYLEARPGAPARTDYAARLAKALGARLEGLAVVPPLRLPQALRSRQRAVELLKEELAGALIDARQATEEFARVANAAGAPEVSAAVVEAEPLEELESRARFFDLLVLAQPDPDDLGVLGGHFVERAILQTGRPVLVVPADVKAKLPPKEALVAWNDGRECSRALASALPLLALSARVTVAAVDEEERETRDVGHAIDYLASHGVAAQAEQLTGDDVGKTLLARGAGADLLVMGAFGHSRMTELVLGGTTREVLAGMKAPVLLSH